MHAEPGSEVLRLAMGAHMSSDALTTLAQELGFDHCEVRREMFGLLKVLETTSIDSNA